MLVKCDANCDAQIKFKPHLWLRNGVFYCRMELPRKNNKRRYCRYSLYTTNYYEALSKMVELNDFNDKFNKLCQLYSQIKVIPKYRDRSMPSGLYGLVLTIPDELYLSKDNDPKTIIDFMNLLNEVNQNIGKYNVQKEIADKLKAMEGKYKLCEKSLNPELLAQIQKNIMVAEPPKHTLQYILDSMLLKAQNGESETKRKTNFLTTIFENLNLSLSDDYSKFHNADNIQKISKDILAQKDVKNDNKRQKLRYIKEFVNFACKLEPDFYKDNILISLPNIEKTKRSERQPHLPYSEAQLKEIFNPEHTFFNDEPDMFWICMIALFTGARRNAATTIQYKNVIFKDNLWCIHFCEDTDAEVNIKHLKNEATERIVPIHKQLLDLGFVDYVNRKKAKLNAKDDDFIFPKCKTSGGQYNNKYIQRYLFEFLQTIGVKDINHDFHSFRKNASLAMQSAGLINSIINAIIGWEGEGTMEQSYSNYDLKKINEELNKFSYAYLQDEFKYWKKIMKNLPKLKK